MNKLTIFFWGIIAAFGALLVEMAILVIFSKQEAVGLEFFSKITFFLITTVLVEEITKTAFISRSFTLLKNSGGLLQNLIIFGAGFSFAEAIFFHFNDFFFFDVLYWQLFGIIFIHILTASLIGYVLEKSQRNTFTTCFFALIFAFLLHLFYNIMIISLLPLQ